MAQAVTQSLYFAGSGGDLTVQPDFNPSGSKVTDAGQVVNYAKGMASRFGPSNPNFAAAIPKLNTIDPANLNPDNYATIQQVVPQLGQVSYQDFQNMLGGKSASNYSIENGTFKDNSSLDANQTPQQLAQNAAVLGARQSGTAINPQSISQSNGNNTSPVVDNGTGSNLPTLANGQPAGGLQMPNSGVGQGLQIPKGQEGFVFDPTTGKQVSPTEAAFNATKASGQKPPQDSSSGSAGVQTAVSNVQAANPQSTPASTPNVDNFFNSNESVQQQMQDLMDLFSPPAQRQQLTDALSQIATDKATLAGINTQLLNIKNVMAGSENDIRNEIQSAGGLATNSQVMALTAARNKTLNQQATQLTDQLNIQKDIVANDTTLYQDEKQMADTQFTQRSGIMKMVQDNQQNILNANRTGIETLLKTPGGLQSLGTDSTQANQIDKLMGWPTGTTLKLAAQPDVALQTQQADLALKQAQIAQIPVDQQLKQAQISNEYATLKKTQAETAKIIADQQMVPGSPAYEAAQDKLAAKATPIIEKTMSNRSGGLGLQDAKVNQAIHLATLMNQFKDPKTGVFNIPKSQYAELAIGMANLISPTNQASDSMRADIMQRTAKGDLNGALTYITGTPFNGSSQDVYNMLAESIDRQGQTSEQLRQTYLDNLKSLVKGAAPGLDPVREQNMMDALELNHYSGILNHTHNGIILPSNPSSSNSAPSYNGIKLPN